MQTEGDKEDNQKNNPKLVIILSGKRKSGKDHVAGILDRAWVFSLTHKLL